VARKTKLTPDVQQRIVDDIGQGATYELAAQYGGIAYNTFNEWCKNKPEFNEAVKEAEGRAVVKWLYKIEQAASKGQWQAAAWKLERRYPYVYGKTVVDNTHRFKNLDDMTDDELRDIAAGRIPGQRAPQIP
jgi:hypothetical protein